MRRGHFVIGKNAAAPCSIAPAETGLATCTKSRRNTGDRRAGVHALLRSARLRRTRADTARRGGGPLCQGVAAGSPEAPTSCRGRAGRSRLSGKEYSPCPAEHRVSLIEFCRPAACRQLTRRCPPRPLRRRGRHAPGRGRFVTAWRSWPSHSRALTWLIWARIKPQVSPIFFVALLVCAGTAGSARRCWRRLSAFMSIYAFSDPVFSLRVEADDFLDRRVHGRVRRRRRPGRRAPPGRGGATGGPRGARAAVADRTRDLARLNEALRHEVGEKQAAQSKLIEHQASLQDLAAEVVLAEQRKRRASPAPPRRARPAAGPVTDPRGRHRRDRGPCGVGPRDRGDRRARGGGGHQDPLHHLRTEPAGPLRAGAAGGAGVARRAVAAGTARTSRSTCPAGRQALGGPQRHALPHDPRAARQRRQARAGDAGHGAAAPATAARSRSWSRTTASGSTRHAWRPTGATPRRSACSAYASGSSRTGARCTCSPSPERARR